MISFILKRLAWSVVVLWIAVSVVLVLMFGIGDPAAATLGPKASPQALAAFRKKHGYDRPFHEQYLSYLGGLVTRGDLGKSVRDEQPVLDIVLTRLPRTALLGGLAVLVEVIVGLGIGIVASRWRNTWLDTSLMAATFVGISAPTFVTGLLFLNWLAFRGGWFPIGGYGTDPLDVLHHAILPSLTLAILGAATYARVMRSEMIETLRADYVRTARAKGVGPVRALFVHGARNALLPIVTMVGLSLASLVSGAVITESIYAWPGLGRLAVEAIAGLDGPVVVGIVLFACAAVQVGNLLADIAVAALDPRVRLGD